MPLNPPAFAPPAWPRLGERRDAAPAIGGLAPEPIEIPICWLTEPVRLRLNTPYTTAAVSRTGAGPSPAENETALAKYGDFPFTAELATLIDADPSNLAHWTVTYQGTPRMRSPELFINLMFRSDEEKLRLLRIEHGQRIQITGVPAEFPEGASSLVIGGIGHEIGIATEMLRFSTRSVIGIAAGLPGPWFRIGSSVLGGTDIVPY